MYLKRLSVVIIFFFLSPAPAVRADPQNISAGGQLTPAKKFVVDKVVAGQVADLQEAFGPEAGPRLIRAAFLEALLTNLLPEVKVHYF
jgi:hypothetical protein